MNTRNQKERHQNNQNILKTISIFFIIVLVANILLFSFRIYSVTIMWAVIVVVAIFAFPGMKMLKRRMK